MTAPLFDAEDLVLFAVFTASLRGATTVSAGIFLKTSTESTGTTFTAAEAIAAHKNSSEKSIHFTKELTIQAVFKANRQRRFKTKHLAIYRVLKA